MESTHHRELFSQEYIASNCTIAFDPFTNVDDTVGTWASNYVIGAIGILLGIFFLANVYPCRRNPAPEWPSTTIQQQKNTALFWQSLYFILTALGYGVAGVHHQVYHSVDSRPEAFVVVPGILVIVSMIPLQLSVTEVWDNSRGVRDILRLVHACVAAAMVIVTVLLETLLATGFYNLVVLVVLAGYYIRCFTSSGRSIMRYIAAMGNAFIIAGLLAYVFLAPVCGSEEAYENCFRDCPLPTNPLVFNHNALFHTLVALGLLFQGIGFYWWPLDEETASDDSVNKGSSSEHDDSVSTNV
ncbi:MAG: hypothetical protein SGILL_010796 [Bacillariaceae sp.]